MFFITTINKDDYRCVGYYSKIDKAVNTVVYNKGDLYEAGWYPYAVIEEIKEGIYQYDQEPMWFKFNEKTERYEECEKPSFIDDHLVGFAIG